jgi:hypothetical protein
MRIAQPAVVLAFLAGCGGAPAKPEPTPEPTRTPLEIRQDAACEQVGPRVIDCALNDLEAATSPEELAKLDLDKMRAANIRKFTTACTGQYMSSRQVRVYEVCAAEETECEPLLACLDNALPKK